MAVQVHSPRGICGRPGEPGPAPKAHGLAVWVTPSGGQDIDEAVMARAAELLLARALKIAPEAEVHIWPAAGAATPATPTVPKGGPQGNTRQRKPRAVSFFSGGLHGALPGGRRQCYPAPAVGRSRHPGVRRPCRRRGAAGRTAGGADRRRVQAAALPRGELLPAHQPGGAAAVPRIVRFPRAASRSIDVYVGRVRRKLRRARHAIVTVRGGGYQFVPGPRAKVRGPAEYSI